MAKNTQPVQVPITVSLNPGSYEFVKANSKGDVGGTLAGWVTFWADNQSRGGMMLSPEDHEFLAGLNEGKKFGSSRELANAIAKGLKREDGQFSFQVSMDPALVQPLQDYADTQGVTLEQLVIDGTQTLWGNGWLYDVSLPDGRMIPFTGAMLDAAKKICDKANVNSADIAGMIAEGRFVPVSAETVAEVAALTDRNAGSLDASHYAGLISEVRRLREEVAELKARELVAA